MIYIRFLKMDESKDTVGSSVCRLCLIMSQNEFVLIDETVRQMLDILLVKMNLEVSDKPLMCENCADIVKSSLSFKSVCADSEEFKRLFVTGKDKTSVDLEDVCNLKDKSHDVCRFCLQKAEKENFIPLDVLMKENTFSDMVKEYMSEVDLNIVKDSLVCRLCRNNMENYFKFLQNCHDTEEKINTYQQNNGIRTEKIMLISVVETFSEYTKKEEMCNSKMEIKEEIDMEEEIETDPLLCQEELTSDRIPCTCDTKDCGCFRLCVWLRETAPHIEEVKVETVKSELNNQALKIETEELIPKDKVTLNESIQKEKPRTEMCLRRNSQFEIVSKGPMVYKCKLCLYQGSSIKTHMLRHRNKSEVQIYQCDRCKYLTKYNNRFNTHLLTHKDSSVVQMYRCDSCEYQTKRKGHLNKHLLTHKDSSDVQMYQCDCCGFQTKYKESLKDHMLTHKDSSDVQMYQCDTCKFQTKYRTNLRNHLLTHKDSSDVQMYQCDSCQYQTKYKSCLKKHFLIHQDSSDVQMYQCDSCHYQTKYKGDLKKHLLIHKDSSDVQMYQCDSCEFKTKYKWNIKNHLLTHKDSSDMQIYQCDSCNYQTKYKRSLKYHLLVHKDVQVYQCGSCEYQTKKKGCLKSHLLTHKDSSNVQMYQCDSCKYQTKYKSSLNKHLLTHKDSSDVQMYQCDNCKFQSKYQKSLMDHFLNAHGIYIH